MDYIFGLSDNQRGRYLTAYDVEIAQMMEKVPDWSAFVEACFEPGSELNRKLKQMVTDMAGLRR